MSRLEVLCVTMHQKDFSKVEKMKIKSDAIFANQDDYTNYQVKKDGQYTIRMLSTDTRGVGKNRNLALTYAKGELCLLADDDITFVEGYNDIICRVFDELPQADLIIFNLNNNSKTRKSKNINKCTRMRKFSPNPYGACRVAFRLKSQRKLNIWFSNLFGGGCIYPSGEDSFFINEFRKKGCIYLCPEIIGTVDFTTSTWFTGYNESYYFGKGAYCAAEHKKNLLVWEVYYALRTKHMTKLTFWDCLKWIHWGAFSYKDLMSFEEWCHLKKIKIGD